MATVEVVRNALENGVERDPSNREDDFNATMQLREDR